MGVLQSLASFVTSIPGIVEGGSAVIASGYAAWRFVLVDIRIEPVDQGLEWERFFQAGADWHLKVMVRNRGKARAEHIRVGVDRIELLDWAGKLLAARNGLEVVLQPMRDEGERPETLRLEGARARGGFAAVPHTVRVKGQVVARAFGPFGRTFSFSFVTKPLGSRNGEMIESDW